MLDQKRGGEPRVVVTTTVDGASSMKAGELLALYCASVNLMSPSSKHFIPTAATSLFGSLRADRAYTEERWDEQGLDASNNKSVEHLRTAV